MRKYLYAMHIYNIILYSQAQHTHTFIHMQSCICLLLTSRYFIHAVWSPPVYEPSTGYGSRVWAISFSQMWSQKDSRRDVSLLLPLQEKLCLYLSDPTEHLHTLYSVRKIYVNTLWPIECVWLYLGAVGRYAYIMLRWNRQHEAPVVSMSQAGGKWWQVPGSFPCFNDLITNSYI